MSSGPAPFEPGLEAELRAAVASFADGPTAPVVDAAAIERAVSRSRTRRALLGTAAACCVLACATVGFFALKPVPPAPGASPSLSSPANGACTPLATGTPKSGSADATPTQEQEQTAGAGIALPDLAGMPVEQAGSLLRGLGLSCTIMRHTDWNAPAGQVISSQPRGGAEPVAPGSSVLLLVSTGKPGGT
ncbi:PASTA domain-containing protein [Streptomyces atratus]|uniref:PASTA domain-containing protein n=1 Tax=Streptomyces TaxID=1883 RepID=UPI0021A62FF3|nr:PASTA domain-containing protein [Streptomyces atratus]MCT2545685.1 PASTA domain-containing protein [Streptomyces atratus]